MSVCEFDVLIAGGGLAGTLTAYRLRQRRPELRLLLLESGARLGGNHTWSFHDTDISPEARSWLRPFVTYRWPRQEVRFPKHRRVLDSAYNTISSETLHQAAIENLSDCVLFSARAARLEPHRVTLEDGRVLTSHCVIDARGPRSLDGIAIGYQKFLGLVVRCQSPHGQGQPIIMDATVPQRDGYRFVYTLPFTPNEILIEDTYYSESPEIDAPQLRSLCKDYARTRGWDIGEVIREEQGLLPVVLAGSVEAISQSKESGVPRLGLGGGFFHHTTSYSLPFAVRLADAVAAIDPLTSERLDGLVDGRARRHWQRQRFFRLLNRMLFWAAEPAGRYRILERFYELQEPLIERFYSSELTLSDRARILAGWPPVPIHRALRVIPETQTNPMAQAAPLAS